MPVECIPQELKNGGLIFLRIFDEGTSKNSFFDDQIIKTLLEFQGILRARCPHSKND